MSTPITLTDLCGTTPEAFVPDPHLLQVNWYHYQRKDGSLTPRWREAALFTQEAADREAKRQSESCKAVIEVVSVAAIAAAHADAEMVERAEALAIRVHEGQTRRGGAPYIEHCRAVAARVSSPVEKAVAFLHDSVEDARIRFSDLDIEGLPGDVIRGVGTLTRMRNVDGCNWAETYEAFIERVRVTDCGRWVPVKLADICANIADNPSPKQLRKYAKALLVLVPEQPFTSRS